MECPECGAELINGNCPFLAAQWHEGSADLDLLPRLDDLDVSDIS